MNDGLLDELVDALRCLPGVGPKSAQRMALHLLQRDRKGATRLGEVMTRAMQSVQHCGQCRIFTENALCSYCSDTSRDAAQLCVVENPADVIAIEKSTDYRGRFFEGEVKELTLATNQSVEGQATARYITTLATDRNVAVMQIARGIPIGSELEFADSNTLSVAFEQRTPLAKS